MSEEVKKFLQKYEGRSRFLLSLKDQLERRGSLSERQIACVEKTMRGERPARRDRSEAPARAERSYSDRYIYVVLKQWDEASEVQGSSWDEAVANEMAEKLTDKYGRGYVVKTKVTYPERGRREEPKKEQPKKDFMSELEAV